MFTSDNPFKLGLIGLGIGKSIGIPAINLVPEIQLTALYGRSQSIVQSLSSDLNIKGFTDLTAMLSDNDIDGFWIATPPEPRTEILQACFENGKHTFLEKPISTSTDHIKQLIQIGLQKNLYSAVDFEYRKVPLFIKVKELISSGFIGSPTFINMKWIMGNRSDPNIPWSWYNSTQLGGGIINAIASHHIDLLLWYFGDIVSVSSTSRTLVKERVDASTQLLRDCDSPETAFLSFEFLNEAIGSIIVSGVTQHGPTQSIEIYGTEGRIFLNSANPNDAIRGFTIDGIGRGGSFLNLESPSDPVDSLQKNGMILPISLLLKDWVNSINLHKPISPTLLDGFRVQEVLDASHASVLQARKISIPTR